VIEPLKVAAAPVQGLRESGPPRQEAVEHENSQAVPVERADEAQPACLV
jgi:hypothetical protein